LLLALPIAASGCLKQGQLYSNVQNFSYLFTHQYTRFHEGKRKKSYREPEAKRGLGVHGRSRLRLR
jgi:hypothetical protein